MPTPTPISTDPPPDTHYQYAQLLASIDGIVWEADARTFRFTFVSEQAERLLGYPLQAWLVPNFWADHLHPGDRDWALDLCERATREKHLHDFEYRMIAADGRVVWLRDIVTVVVEGDEPSKLRGVMVDVTERKWVEDERLEHVRFLERLDRVNRAIQGATDVDGMMRDVLETVLTVYGCDRAWLVYPCDPEAPTWKSVMERTRPEYPGAYQAGTELPVHADVAELFRLVRSVGAPVRFGPGSGRSVPREAADLFSIQSQLCFAIYPKVDKPYLFGIHQCSYPREWSASEQRLFQEIGRRLSDALTTLLVYRRLHASEARFRVLVDHASDAFFLHDADGVILDVNRQACASLGYTRDELIGLSPCDFDPEVDPPALAALMARLAAGEALVFDTRHRRKDGSVFPVEVRTSPFREAGKGYAVSLARDITERKKAEEATRQREADLNLALEAGRMGDWKWVVGEPGVHWSDRCKAIYGLPPEAEVSYDLFLSLVHPDDRDRVVAELQRTVETGADYEAEKRIIRPDGMVRWTATRAQAFRDASGRLLSVAGLTTDVTDRKQAQEALRESEELYRLLTENSNDLIYLLDLDGRIAYASPSVGRLLGVVPRFKFDVIHPNDVAAARVYWERVLAGGAEQMTFRVRDGGGGWHALEAYSSLVRHQGRPHVLSVCRDITERKKAEEALAAREAELRNLAESSPGLMAAYHVRSDGTVCMPYASHRIWDLFGLRPEDVRDDATPLLARIHPDDYAGVQETVVESARTMTLWRREYRVNHPTRGELWLEGNTTPNPHPDGGVIWHGFVHDITDRKQGEERRRLVEERFRLVWSHSGDGMRLSDVDGTVLMVNDAFCRLVGLPRESLEGQSLAVIQLPEFRERVIRLHRERFDSRSVPARMQRSLMLWNGTQIWVELTNSFLEGSRPLLLSTFRDISERKRAEEALRVSEQRLEAAQQMAHVGWWERDLVTGRASRSRESYRIFGLAPAAWDDLPTWDQKWHECIHPDDLARTTEALRRALAGGPRYDLEYRIVRPSGEVRTIHSQGDITHGSDGRPVRMFGTMQDVTELRHIADELRASEARFRTFVDHASDAFFLHDRDAKVLDVNRQACASLGYTRDELIGMHPTTFDAVLDAATVEGFVTRLDSGEVLGFETLHRRKDGTVFPVEVRVRPFWEGGRRYSVSLARDMTDRKRLEEQFQQAQKMEAVGLLAGGVAHDFNNLLTVINCYSEMVFGRLATADPNRALVAEIQKSGERAANLTRQLLAFSRKQVLLPQVVSANTLVDELAKMLRRLIGEDIELVLELDPHLGVTKVDPGQFEQAVINLVVNARDAMPDGGRVAVATRNVDRPDTADAPPGSYVVVSVSDTGHGMDEATQGHIFEPFFTTKGVGRGTGLGLAMVYGFVKQSGGHVEVASEVGRGTTFRVYLPRAEAVAPIGRPPRSRLLVPTGTERVLLVEDDDSVRELSRTILESCGYKVLEARDGEHGVAVAREAGRIDLLVTDLVMPRMSGRRLADELLAVRPNLRVLFLSGYTDEAVLTRGIDTQDIAFLHKPFTVTSLAHKVREVLDSE